MTVYIGLARCCLYVDGRPYDRTEPMDKVYYVEAILPGGTKATVSLSRGFRLKRSEAAPHIVCESSRTGRCGSLLLFFI